VPYKSPEARREWQRNYYPPRSQACWERIIAQLGGECADCHQKFRRHIYDLHHLDPQVKEQTFNPTWSWARIEKYIVGCVLLCTNCHRERHYKIREEKA